MATMTNSERADRLTRRRTRMLPILVLVYLSQQATFFSTFASGAHRDVDHFKIGAWVVLSLVLLAALATKGFWLQPRAVRDLIDDESTRANRLEAMRIGFLVACGAAIAAYFIAEFEPLTVGETAHLVLSLGIGAALIRFAMLERRTHRDG